MAASSHLLPRLTAAASLRTSTTKSITQSSAAASACTSLQSARTFVSSPAARYRQPPVPASDIPIPSPRAHKSQQHIPAYPYGERQVYKQSNMGLYGSVRIQFGNHVSEKHEVKTRRKWRPNVHEKRLWSPSLGVFVRTRITPRVLRTVDKCGGLDEYLLGTKPARVRELGPWGWKLRWRIMQTPAVRERFAREREALGLPPREEEDDGGLLAAASEDLVSQTTVEELLEETERMLKNEEEFPVGEDLESAEAELEGNNQSFMHEEKQPKRS